VIYLADMGWFIPKCRVILANIDEPLDPGVLVEIVHARARGKRVIGYRTDVRSPYGTLNDPLRGVHFFPAYQCHSFLHFTEAGRSMADVDVSLNRLTSRLHQEIQRQLSLGIGSEASSVESTLSVLAERLFGGLEPLNSPESLRIITDRSVAERDAIAMLRPALLDLGEPGDRVSDSEALKPLAMNATHSFRTLAMGDQCSNGV